MVDTFGKAIGRPSPTEMRKHLHTVLDMVRARIDAGQCTELAIFVIGPDRKDESSPAPYSGTRCLVAAESLPVFQKLYLEQLDVWREHYGRHGVPVDELLAHGTQQYLEGKQGG